MERNHREEHYVARVGWLRAVGAKAGGANILRAVMRVTFWGAVAMAVTWGVGRVFGAVV